MVSLFVILLVAFPFRSNSVRPIFVVDVLPLATAVFETHRYHAYGEAGADVDDTGKERKSEEQLQPRKKKLAEEKSKKQQSGFTGHERRRGSGRLSGRDTNDADENRNDLEMSTVGSHELLLGEKSSTELLFTNTGSLPIGYIEIRLTVSPSLHAVYCLFPPQLGDLC